MRSSIFLNEISVIDHSYIDDTGFLRGGSFLCSFIVTGEVDETEKVVVDFSTIKKDIKNIIDKHSRNPNENGFDHQLWVINGYSDYTKTQNGNDVYISTPICKLQAPGQFVKEFNGVSYFSAEQAIADHVLTALNVNYPNINLSVECKLSETPVFPPFSTNFNHILFRYVHGLKDSTSMGCKNLHHGHLSYICIEDTQHLLKIQSELQSVIFVNEQNIISQVNDLLEIGYEIDGEGVFNAKYDTSKLKTIILKTETTIEYLLEYFIQHYDITGKVYISEGLNKGACN
jgi:hypothetical protein